MMVENPFGNVPSLKATVSPVRKQDVCFYERKNPPRNAMTYDEGMAYLQAQERRYRKKYNRETVADRARGAHNAAEVYATLYRSFKRKGQKALLASPACIEDEVNAALKDLGFEAIARERGEEQVGPGDDEQETTEGEAMEAEEEPV